MATKAPAKKKKPIKKIKQHTYSWEGVDRNGKPTRGEVAAPDEESARRTIKLGNCAKINKLKKVRRKAKAIVGADIAIMTRQLATMMKAGVPLLQSFDIVAKGHDNRNVTDLLLEIKSTIESGKSLSEAFRMHPRFFNDLYCSLVEAGEQAGILEAILDRLATYEEKMMALKSKIKSALMYPTMVIGASFIITAVIMIFVIPAFKNVFASFGADLPAPTLFVMGLSEFTVSYWYLILGAGIGVFTALKTTHRTSENFRNQVDRLMIKLPIFGSIIEKSIIARWLRTLATMFSAGVPLVQALDSVAGASGNFVYRVATRKIQTQVATGNSLTSAMNNQGLFPVMVIQMAAIGEEAGSLDGMLGKAADSYEKEVDVAVDTLSSLMEPIIMIVLGTIIGGIVVAMYLPIFKLGSAV